VEKHYAIGIDLGTTNSVLAYAKLADDELSIQVLSVPQVVDTATVESREILPSFAYLPTDEEAPGGAFKLPWQQHTTALIGAYGRRQAADAPSRTVAAAKSWLAHSRVDRHAPILPWNAPQEIPKISPLEASRLYLEHLICAWDQDFPDQPLSHQAVVLTVPASFDASARDLTREAALAAGLPEDFVLLEEPQAAVYAWLHNHGDRWRQDLGEGDVLLVCDVGGGTTDFTLIEVASEQGDLVLRRVAVGDHILVGGDNMDLTLAHLATQAFAAQNVEVDPWQSVALWHACRNAKEELLAAHGPEKVSVAILGRGSRLVGGTVSTELDRQQVADTLVEGFFPLCAANEKPARQRTSGFRELGLPFETDTAVTRHLADFLARHGNNGTMQPTHLLFNGGVFKSEGLRQRLEQALGAWAQTPPQVLAGNEDLDFAVARGAAYYAAAKAGKGVRIRGGTARSYYIGIEVAGLAVPGAPRPLRALCVVPHGMEEGSEVRVENGEIGLLVGETTHFRFFSSTVRKEDAAGTDLRRWSEDEVLESDSLEANLPAADDLTEDFVPVRFRSRITELGVFELWCESTISDDKWKLEFSVREED
jgi:molecular chaperone DnaK (HSP70)